MQHRSAFTRRRLLGTAAGVAGVAALGTPVAASPRRTSALA